MVDSSDHITGKTGLSPTVTISKAGASFAAPSGAVTEIGNGWYKVAGNSTDTNTLGEILLHATATGADPYDGKAAQIVSFNPADAVRLGLTALPNAAPDAAGGLPISDAGGLDMDSIKSDSAAIKTQTDKMAFTVANQIDCNVIDWKSSTAPAMTGDAFARLGAPTGVSISADIAAVQAVDDAIKLKTDNLPNDPANEATLTSLAAQVGTAGAGLTALGDTRLANLDAAMSSRLAAADYTAPDNADILAIKAKTDNLPIDPADQSDIITAVNAIGSLIGTGGAALTAIGDTRLANLDAAISSRAVAGDAMTLEAGERDSIAEAKFTKANGVELGITERDCHRLVLSALCGKLSGAATPQVITRDTNDMKNRLIVDADADGNRTAVVLDPT